MTDLTTQLDAILHGAAFAPITDRAFLRITGPDATRWLNGMVTNNIKDLAPGQGNYNFLLNAQGRILGDCTIYREPGEDEPTFLLQTDNSQLQTLNQTFDKFIIMDDVELTSGLHIIGHDALGLLVLGPQSPKLLHHLLSSINDADDPTPLSIPKAGTDTYALLPDRPGFLSLNPVRGLIIVLTPSTSQVPTYELWFEQDKDLKKLLKRLEAVDAYLMTGQALEAYRILSGTPKYGIDIRNTETAKDLPQETAQTHALNFNKGCYLGQEIVERIHSRGNVHRTFTPFTLTGSLPSQLPAPLEVNGKSAGELTSAVQIGDTIYALGYARREALDTHAQLTYSGGVAIPSKLLVPSF